LSKQQQVLGDREKLHVEFLAIQEKLGLPDMKELEPPALPKSGGLFGSPIPEELRQGIRDVGLKLARLKLDGVEVQAKYNPQVAADLSRYRQLKDMFYPKVGKP